jgi:uncharacterized membrane protein YcaP (DUF421 family)
MTEIYTFMTDALGLDKTGQELTAEQMVLRACVIYLFTLFVVKLGKRRFLGKNSELDMVMIIILGSVISRGINGSAAFFPTLGASIALVLMHRASAWLACRSDKFSRLFEGDSILLVSHGTIDWQQMRKHDISENDLYVALRQALNIDDLKKAKAIYLEPNGKFSVVKTDRGN